MRRSSPSRRIHCPIHCPIHRPIHRLIRCLLVAVALSLASGCTYLANEFTWLDRAAPEAVRSPEATVDGSVGRP